MKPFFRYRNRGIFSISLFTFLLHISQIQFARAQWVQTNGPSGSSIAALALHNSVLYAGTFASGIYSSSDQGMFWSNISGDLPLSSFHITCLAVGDDDIFLGTNGGLYISSDNGISWTINAGIGNQQIMSVTESSGEVMIGTLTGPYFSGDNGETWTLVNNGITGQITAVTRSDTNYIASNDVQIFYSNNNGSEWNLGFQFGEGATCFTIMDGNVFSGTSGGILMSDDDGHSWTNPSPAFLSRITAIGNDGINLFAGTINGEIYKSSDEGLTWTGVYNSDAINFWLSINYESGIVYDGTKLYAGNFTSGISSSSNSGLTWDESSDHLLLADVRALINDGENIFAGTDGNGVFISGDDGESWTPANSGLSNKLVDALTLDDSIIFVGTRGKGVFASNDHGASWFAVNNGISDTVINCLLTAGDRIFAGTFSKGIFRSSDNGASWHLTNTGLTDLSVTSIYAQGADLFATTYNGVYRSTNNGDSWQFLNGGKLGCVVALDSTLCTGRIDYNTNISVSQDYGLSWQVAYVNNSRIYSLATDGINLFAGGDGNENGFFISTDSGVNWNKNNDGFMLIPEIRCFTIKNSTIYAGTNGLSVWKRSIGSLVGIDDNPSAELSFEIFPNPGQGEVNIILGEYSEENIHLEIRNILGEIILLRNINPNEIISINLTQQPKGIYFATINNGTKSFSQKLIIR